MHFTAFSDSAAAAAVGDHPVLCRLTRGAPPTTQGTSAAVFIWVSCRESVISGVLMKCSVPMRCSELHIEWNESLHKGECEAGYQFVIIS